MFGIFSREVNRLKAELADRDQRIVLLQEQLADLRSQEAKDAARSGFAADWKRMNAFSIERIVQDGVAVTMIGYCKGPEDKPEVGEWCFRCNQDTHERLVEEFRQYQNR